MRRAALLLACLTCLTCVHDGFGLRTSSRFRNTPSVETSKKQSRVEAAAFRSQSSRHFIATPTSNPLRILATLFFTLHPSATAAVGARSALAECSPALACSHPALLSARTWFTRLSAMSVIPKQDKNATLTSRRAEDENAPGQRLDSSKRDTGFLGSAAAGGVAACMATVVFHPVDTIKTVLQRGGGNSAVHALGIKGLYRGVLPAAFSMMPACAVRMGSYEVLKSALLRTALLQSIPSSVLVFLASACSVVVSCSVRAPLDMVKTRVQADASVSAMTALRKAWGTGGLAGLSGMYRGAGLALARDVPFFGFNLLIYEQLKATLLARKADALRSTLPQQSASNRPALASQAPGSTSVASPTLSPFELLLIGFAAQGIAGFLTNPADALKTRVQSGAAASMGAALQSILKEGGPKALFAGAGMRVAWIAPQGCVYYPVYEMVQKFIGESRLQANAQTVIDSEL